jgi:hypothetical protein
LHTVIPNIIQPYKHYDSLAIQGVISGGGDDCAADNSTMYRWRKEFKEAMPDIEERLCSIYAAETDNHVPLMHEGMTLGGIMEYESDWLSCVMGLLINSGHRLCTRFAFCPGAKADKVILDGKSAGKGNRFHDKTKEDTG